MMTPVINVTYDPFPKIWNIVQRAGGFSSSNILIAHCDDDVKIEGLSQEFNDVDFSMENKYYILIGSSSDSDTLKSKNVLRMKKQDARKMLSEWPTLKMNNTLSQLALPLLVYDSSQSNKIRLYSAELILGLIIDAQCPNMHIIDLTPNGIYHQNIPTDNGQNCDNIITRGNKRVLHIAKTAQDVACSAVELRLIIAFVRQCGLALQENPSLLDANVMIISCQRKGSIEGMIGFLWSILEEPLLGYNAFEKEIRLIKYHTRAKHEEEMQGNISDEALKCLHQFLEEGVEFDE